MVKGKRFGALLMATVMSVTSISIPQLAEAATPSNVQAMQDGSETAQSLSERATGLATLVELDFEDGNVLTTGDFQSTDKKVRAKSSNGYELVEGKDGGKAVKLDKSKKQYLSLSYAPQTTEEKGTDFILKGKDEITISYDLKDAPDSWVVYADRDNSQNNTENQQNYLGVIGATTVERYYGGRDYKTSSSNTTINNAPTSGWHHWDIVVTNDYTKVYVDGVLRGDSISKARLSEILGESGLLYLGAANWQGTPGQFGSFTMDNFKIYDGIAEVAKPQKPTILAELDFEKQHLIQGGDFVTDTLKATQHNGYDLAEGNGGGQAAKIDASKSQYFSLTKTDGSPILSGKNVITLSYDLNGSASNWVVYADKEATQNVSGKENYLGIIGTDRLEYFINGKSNDNARIIPFTGVDTSGWHHWDIEISYGYIKVYEDGVLKGSTPGNSQQKLSDMLGNSSVLYLGAANEGGTPGEFGSFTIDNFRIYDGQQIEYLKSLVSSVTAKNKELEMVADSPATEQMELVLPADLQSYAYQVSYSSSDPSIATVDETGKIKALAKGKATITATLSIGDAQKSVTTTIDSVTAEEILKRQGAKNQIVLNVAKVPARVGDTGEITVEGFDARIQNHPDLKIAFTNSNPIAVELKQDVQNPKKATLKANHTADAVVITANVTIGSETVLVTATLKIEGSQVAAFDFEKEDGAQDQERLKNKAATGKYAVAWGGEENKRADVPDAAMVYEEGFKSASALRLKDFGLRLNTGNIGEEYTVSAWMKSDTEERLSMNQSVLTIGGFIDNDSWMSISGAALGAGNVRVIDSDQNTVELNPNDVFADREWHMVTVTGTKDSANIYIDGMQIGANITTKNPLTATSANDISDIYLGIAKSYTLFGGLVDNVQVYKGARTQKQIAEEVLREIASWEQIKGQNTAQNSITTDLVLPTKLFKEDIKWNSSNTAVLANTGKVNAPTDKAVDVTLTASVKLADGSTPILLTYNLKVVPSNEALLAEAERLYKTYKDDANKITKYLDYTKASWNEVDTSYAAVVAGKDLPLEELRALVNTLKKNVEALVKISDLRSSYQAVVNAKYDKSLYQEDGWQALESALADAKAILDKDNASESISQSTIDDAKKALDSAAGALRKKTQIRANFTFEEATVHPDGGFFCRDGSNTMVRANGNSEENYTLVNGAAGTDKAVSLTGIKRQYLQLQNEEGKPVNVLKTTDTVATISYDLYNGASNQVLYAGNGNDFIGIFGTEFLQVNGNSTNNIELKLLTGKDKDGKPIYAPVPTEGWHHWDIVVTNSYTRVYVDDALVGEGASKLDAITAAGAEYYIGTKQGHTNTTGEYGTFIMDNFNIYQGAPTKYITDDIVKNGFTVDGTVSVTPGSTKARNVNLTATGLMSDTVYKAEYASNDPEIKVDSNGGVTATENVSATTKAKITTTVYCPSHAPIVLQTEVKLNSAAVALQELGIKPEKVNATVIPGWTKQMKVNVPLWVTKGTGYALTYTSSDPAVATVDEKNGIVTAVKEGTATITATASVKATDGATVSSRAVCAELTVKAGAKSVFEFESNLSDISTPPGSDAAEYRGTVSYADGLFGSKAVDLSKGGVNLNRNNIGDAYTVSVWLKKDKALVENQAVLFLGYGVTNGPEKWIGVAGDKNSKAKFWTKQNTDKNGSHYNVRDTIVQMDNFCDNTWHNLTITGETGKVSLYLDGKHIATDNTSINPLSGSNQEIILGSTPWDDSFGGLADRVRVYDATLTENQVYSISKEDAKEALSPVIAEAETRRKNPAYTTVSRKRLDEAYEAAVALTKAEKPEITQLIAARETLQTAINGLVDLEKLKELIEQAQKHKNTVNTNKGNYSTASLNAYNAAIDKALSDAENILVSEEDWTAKQVSDTIAALEMADPGKAIENGKTGWLVDITALKSLIGQANTRLSEVRDANNDTYKKYTQESKNNYCAKLEEQKNVADGLLNTATTTKSVTDQLDKQYEHDNLQKALDNTDLLAETDIVNAQRKLITDALKNTGDYQKKHTEQTNPNHVGEFVYTADSRKAVEDAIAALNGLYEKLPLDTTTEMLNNVAKAIKNLEDAVKNLTEVDYSLSDEVQKLLDEAGKLKEEDYTADSWKNLTDTCKELETLMTNITGNEQLTAARTALQNAMRSLISIVDLKGVIDDFKVKYIEDQYTKASWADYKKVMDEAVKVLEDPAETRDHIAFVKNKLENAPNGLVSVTELKAAIENATDVDGGYTKYKETDYTAASWKTYHDVCEAAKTLLTTEEAVTSQQLSKAVEQIKSAVDCLVSIVSLREAIATAEATYLEGVFTGSSWENYKAALEAAKGVLAKADASNTDIETAISNLNRAIDALVSPNKLADVIKDAESQGYKQDDYTAGSWDAYQDKLQAAKTVAANPAATSEEIATAVAELTGARNGLISTVSLKKAIEDALAQNFNEDLYTPDSWSAYKKALDDAQATLNDKPSATKAEIENVTANLNNAVKNLQAVDFDDTDANAAIRRAEALYSGDYTADSYQAVSTALGELKELLQSEQVTEALIRPAINKLNEAIENLVSIVTLKENIQAVQDLNYSQRQYTAASWKVYSDALAYAQEIVAKANATNSEVAKAVSDLNTGIRSLVSIAELSDAIQKAERQGYRAQDYTKNSWDTYQAALQTAKTTVAKENAERIEVKNAAEALETAINNLISVTDINTEIANVENKYSEAQYTAASWKQFSDALSAAKAAAAKADASESEIANAKNALTAAINNLVSVTDINAAIANVENKYSQAQYTAASWTQFSNALAAAKAAAAKADATESEITNAKNALTAAANNLISVAELNTAIANAENNYSEAQYTAASWKQFSDALSAAKAVAAKADASESEITNAKNALATAISNLTIKPEQPESLKINMSNITIGINETAQLKVTGATSKVTFSSSSKKIAYVNSKGKFRAKRPGTAIITATTAKGAMITCKVTVKNLSINIKNITLGAGEAATLKVTGAAGKITYKSSNTSIVYVNSKGNFRAKKAGKATISATTATGAKITCKIVVKKAPSKVTLSKSEVSLKKGATLTLSPKLPGGTASYKKTFKSSNTSVATVSAAGKVTAVKKGTATITVKTFNGKTAKIKVTVK